MIIKSIDLMSLAKLLGVIYAGFGLLIGLFFSAVSLIGVSVGDQGAAAGILFGVGAVILLPILYGIGGFIGGLITAVIYNLAAGVIGGLEFEIEGVPSQRPASPQPAAPGPGID